jgi:hypothetical protein
MPHSPAQHATTRSVGNGHVSAPTCPRRRAASGGAGKSRCAEVHRTSYSARTTSGHVRASARTRTDTPPSATSCSPSEQPSISRLACARSGRRRTAKEAVCEAWPCPCGTVGVNSAFWPLGAHAVRACALQFRAEKKRERYYRTAAPAQVLSQWPHGAWHLSMATAYSTHSTMVCGQ